MKNETEHDEWMGFFDGLAWALPFSMILWGFILLGVAWVVS